MLFNAWNIWAWDIELLRHFPLCQWYTTIQTIPVLYYFKFTLIKIFFKKIIKLTGLYRQINLFYNICFVTHDIKESKLIATFMIYILNIRHIMSKTFPKKLFTSSWKYDIINISTQFEIKSKKISTQQASLILSGFCCVIV